MKKLILLSLGISVTFAVDLGAQVPEVLRPSIAAKSNTFRSYAALNPTTPRVLVFDADEEMANQLYIPKPAAGTRVARITPAVVAATSSMFNQTTSSNLPVTTLKNYTGLGTGFNGTWTVQGLLPPDTTMGVGLTQIVQWVNVKLTVLDKTTGAPTLGGAGFINANQIWAGLGPGSKCATTNQGDPIVQFDRLSGRWVLMQFAFGTGTSTNGSNTSYPAAPYSLCWAVSQTGDATGAYNLYEYVVSALPDYPKLGVWTDAYYVTANDFSFSTVTGASTYVGTRYCAADRAKMIAGDPAATQVCFSGLNATHFGALPADFEGTVQPPAGENQFVISGDWFNLNAPPYSLQLRRFKPDFVTPANSTLISTSFSPIEGSIPDAICMTSAAPGASAATYFMLAGNVKDAEFMVLSSRVEFECLHCSTAMQRRGCRSHRRILAARNASQYDH